MDTIEKIDKSILKTVDYYEFREGFFDRLPDLLTVPTSVIKKVNKEVTTEEEMTKDRQLLEKEEAFGLASKMLTKKDDGLIWFEDDGSLWNIDIWHRDDSHVHVFKYYSDNCWDKGTKSFFRS